MRYEGNKLPVGRPRTEGEMDKVFQMMRDFVAMKNLQKKRKEARLELKHQRMVALRRLLCLQERARKKRAALKKKLKRRKRRK